MNSRQRVLAVVCLAVTLAVLASGTPVRTVQVSEDQTAPEHTQAAVEAVPAAAPDASQARQQPAAAAPDDDDDDDDDDDLDLDVVDDDDDDDDDEGTAASPSDDDDDDDDDYFGGLFDDILGDDDDDDDDDETNAVAQPVAAVSAPVESASDEQLNSAEDATDSATDGELGANDSTRMPSVYVSKYNRFVDNIIGRVNKILRQSYDPVRVRLQSSSSAKKKNGKGRTESTDEAARSAQQPPKKKSNGRPKARATLFGLSSIRRQGDVTVNNMADHTTIRTNFLLGPLTLRVEKEFGRGAKRELKSATATTAEMQGRLSLRVMPGGAATLHSIRVLQPKQVRVDSSDNHDRTREFVWRRSSHIARVVSQKLANATKSMLRPPPAARQSSQHPISI